ncbi:hypothetical protein V2W30_07095 [Streptomyces sp. Q6]|uniref:Uncharacterized protein n=1 Tax=Streptomyces citrinus TaxID=3118173 RepID=A0ACD5A7Q9_9ACTN
MYADFTPEHGSDTLLLRAVRTVVGHGVTGHWSGDVPHALRQIKAVGDVLSGLPASGPAPHRGTPPLANGWTRDDGTVPAGGAGWPRLLPHLTALARRATVPFTDESERTALLHLFDALASGPLAAGTATLRRVVLREQPLKQGQTPQRRGEVHRCGERTVVLLHSENVYDSTYQHRTVEWIGLDHDPSGAFGAVGHFTVHRSEPLAASLGGDRLTELAALVREFGPVAWSPDAVAELAAAPGCGPAQAALLLLGRPGGTLTADDLAECRDVAGLTRTQVEAGEQRLRALPADARYEVAAALLPADTAALWRTGPDVAAARAGWTERFGGLVRLTEDVDTVALGIPDLSATEAVLNPDRHAWLSRTTTQRVAEQGRLTADAPEALPRPRTLTAAVDGLAALAYGLPYGHPLRAVLPAGQVALRARLADPGLFLDCGLSWPEKGRATTAARLRTAYGLPEAGGEDADGLTRAGAAFVLHPAHGDREMTLLRPAGLTGPDDPAIGLVEGIVGSGAARMLRRIAALLGGDLTRALAADGDFEGPAQDPTRSVPALVTEVAADRGIGADAAALYLQLLALPDPTDRSTARWTGWKPARLKKARAELAATDLVVEAKRARAGRGLFLPGPWLALKAPALPLEGWKSGFYDVTGHTRTVPLLPVPELFARAWERVRSGDVPAYEELTTRATRKGRARG